LDAIALKPEVGALLGLDHVTAAMEGRGNPEDAWENGLKTLYGGGNVKVLGRGGEGVAYEVKEHGEADIYKGYRYAQQVPFGALGAREGDIGAAYSKALLRSPYLAGPSHYILGTGPEGTAPEVVLKLPAERVKELVKAAGQGDLPQGLRLFGVLMPKAKGHSLNQHPGSFTDRQISQTANGLYRALTETAAHRTIHNDIKPDNVIMDPESGAIKLIDLGGLQKLSKSADPQSALGTSIGSVTETPAYRAPWVDGTIRFGPDVDRYAFGITLLAMALKAPGDDGSDASSSIQAMEQALIGFKRSADRPESLLHDVLEQIRSNDQPLHDRLKDHLESRPVFHDFLQTLFQSSLPGDNGNSHWASLDGHPFLT
jgi:serine/threonine protein kinase